MKKLFSLIFSLICALGILQITAGCAMLGGGYKIKTPDFNEEKLPNGLRLIHVRDRSLPLINFAVMVSPGAISDPVGRSGLTFTTIEMMEKGTQTKTADQIADGYAALGTSLSSSVDEDYILFSVEAMAKHQMTVFDLLKDVLLKPSFDKAETELFKKRLVAVIRQNYDDPNVVADRAFTRISMGSHLYVRPVQGTIRDINSLKAEDLQAHYRQILRPENTTVIVTGDLTPDFLNQVRSTFAGWSPATPKMDLPLIFNKPPAEQKQMVIVDRNDLQQTQIRIGHLGIQRNDPDYWPVQVANVILGGNFTSRLMREVRVKRGLTYGIRSSFEAGVYAGPFSVSTFTRHDKVGEAVSVTLDLLKSFRESGVTDAEVIAGRNYLKGHLIRAFEKPEDIVLAMARMRIYSLTPDEISNVVNKVEGVSASDVNRVIKKHFRPDQMRTVIYSSKDKVVDQLRPLGALEVRPVTDFQN